MELSQGYGRVMVTVEAELSKREEEFVRVLQAGAGADVAVYQKVPASV